MYLQQAAKKIKIFLLEGVYDIVLKKYPFGFCGSLNPWVSKNKPRILYYFIHPSRQEGLQSTTR